MGNKRIIFTPADEQQLRSLWPNHSAAEIAAIMGRTKGSIYYHAERLNLMKDKSFLQECGKKVSGHPNSLMFRFKKGYVPPNKGKKMSAEHYAKAARTMFKPGNIPANHMPVGSEVVTTDGYLKVKIAEPKMWRLKSYLVWESVNGKVPPGHIIEYIDGNRLNCSIDNLRLISRARQLKEENSLMARYPEELQKVIHLKASIKRKITIANKKKS